MITLIALIILIFYDIKRTFHKTDVHDWDTAADLSKSPWPTDLLGGRGSEFSSGLSESAGEPEVRIYMYTSNTSNLDMKKKIGQFLDKITNTK